MEITVDQTCIEDVLELPLVMGLLESISDGALVIDANTRAIAAMNGKARELLGYKEQEVMGCQCKKMMNSPACSNACPLTAILQGKREQSKLELYYRGHKGQALLHAHTRMVLLRDPTGQPLAGIELFSDLRKVRQLQEALRERTSLRGIIGRAPVMQRLYKMVEQIAAYPIPVLITGPSGVGKERFADAVHYHSDRAAGRFVKVNCAGFSSELVESELFGHRRGAFTGASTDRRGYFEEAHGGSLLLDEVGELPGHLQAKLLRVLQEGEIQRVGEDRVRKVDVRIIAATNRDLEEDVAAGRFREDLYYRLMGARLHIPCLDERREDLPLLAEYFVARFRKDFKKPDLLIADDLIPALSKRDWPGNVRELENVLRLAVIRALAEGTLRTEHLEQVRILTKQASASLNLEELEQQAIDTAMTRTDGNMSAAARLLGIDRSTLWRKLKAR